jgi:hypothetical protein
MSARQHVRGEVADRGAVVNVHPLLRHRRVGAAKARERDLAFGQELHPRVAFGHPGEHETVDRFRPDHITDSLSRVTIAAGYQDLVPALSRCGHQEVEEFQHDRVIRAKLGVRDRVGDPVGPARAQAGGSRMGLVVQLLDRGQDPVPGSGTEPATTVDDVGNGLPRYPRSPRHVVDRGARGGTRPA